MLKKTVISLASAVFVGGAVASPDAFADDDLWDLMNPGWWMDQMDDDDDDWRYWRHAPGPYGYGNPYGWGYPAAGYWYQPAQQPTKKKPPELPIPE